ncbi:hypothetical protein [Corynebacterium simulans]|uniref:hypothetical protein n=1 Tax=Corynebacterium simulans TaxID=146827 RepID=UPI00066C127F|nr:hypothetical protein [Corynebacterium simulans]MCK6161402.1 hypothetical protein [Corynebacterium simulans]
MRARLRRPKRGWVTAYIHLKPGSSAGNHTRVRLEFTQRDGFQPATVELDQAAAFALSNELTDYFESLRPRQVT